MNDVDDAVAVNVPRDGNALLSETVRDEREVVDIDLSVSRDIPGLGNHWFALSIRQILNDMRHLDYSSATGCKEIPRQEFHEA